MSVTRDSRARREATRGRVTQLAGDIYGDVAITEVGSNAAELHVDGKLTCVAWTVTSDPLLLLGALLRSSLRIRRARLRRALKALDKPLGKARAPLYALDDWGDDDLLDDRPVARDPSSAIRLDAALSYHRRVPSSLAETGLMIAIRILPNLKLRLETAEGSLLIEGAWRSSGVEWNGEPMPEIPCCVLDSVAEDVAGAMELFRSGRLDAAKWTSDRRVLRVLRPPPRGTTRSVATPD